MDGREGDKLPQNIVPFTDDDDCDHDDYVTEENGFGTQVVDIDSETQVMNLGFETQEVNLAGETQLIEIANCIDTQLLDRFGDEVAADSDEEGTNRTEVLEDNGELSDDDSSGQGTVQLSGKVSIHRNNLCGDETDGLARLSEAMVKDQRSSGCVGRLTSVRTAAFRASGLAARNARLKVPNSESRSVLTNCLSSDQGAMDNDTPERYVREEVDQLHNEKTNGLGNGNRTARKLFGDGDYLSEPKENSQSELAGLSYVDSQEPEEASQANALNFVDKFVNDNCLRFEDEFVYGKNSGEKSKHVSSVNGPQIMAKKAGYRSGGKESGIFDWDDKCEDEGGGDILCRRKEELFGTESCSRKSFCVPRKPKGKWLDGCGKEDEPQNPTNKISSLSDSRLVGHNNLESGEKVQVAGMKSKNNLVNKLNRELKGNNIRTHKADEVVDVGPDTQMAAEAMEALNCGYSNNRDVDNCSYQDGQYKNKISQMENELLSREGSGLCGSWVVKRQSRRTMRIDSMEMLKGGIKRARSLPFKISGKKMEGVSKGVQLDKSNKSEGCSSDKIRQSKNKVYDSRLFNQSSKDGPIEASSYPKRRRSNRNLPCQPSVSGGDRDSFDTPVKSKTPVNNASPICMGDEYLKQSCKNPTKSFSSRKIHHLTLAQTMLESKSSRKRRDLGSVCVLFSQHLDEDVTKHQKKILVRLGISEASSIMEATHFVADKFVRTRNMLEAVASGKHVVTTLWLESIGQVNIYIDEEAYILRDTKKEKEFGFSMPFSLARARQHPLLQGRKVFITPNTKPGKETIMTLVKAVRGQAVERLGRSAMKDDKVADNLLVLSCEEDYSICVPFLERGAEVYSSELLLNGIVTQKLEYERHRLFADCVKRTRSTVWLRNNRGEFHPLTNNK